MKPTNYCDRLKSLSAALLLASNAMAVNAATPSLPEHVPEIAYQPQKVVYDVAVAGRAAFAERLDRVSYLNSIYHADPFDASIVLVLHGDELAFFATRNQEKFRDLIQRARSLELSGPIRFLVCRAAAKMRGFAPEDFYDFVEIVPMADAEIVRLQQEEGYAYLR
jgi:intracellular sulfur oxidation DsrE/DsrF family protein